jgi:cytochrome P450
LITGGPERAGEHRRLFALEPEAVRCPYPTFEWLRREAPVIWVDEIESFVVTRYEDIAWVLKRPELFSSTAATGPVLARQMADGVAAILAEPQDERLGPVLSRVNRMGVKVLLSADPPLHRRQRNLVNRAFTQRRVRQSEPAIRALAEELVDRFPDQGPVEFVAAFAVPLPLSVIADRLGVPRADLPAFKRWSDDFTVAIGNHHLGPEELKAMLLSQAEFFAYFEAMVEQRRAVPGDDLLSELANARLPDGDALSMAELLGMLNQFLVAGNETTTKLLASAVCRLAGDSVLCDRLRSDPALIEPFVEEVLRLEAPVQGLYRTAIEDCTVGGHPVPAGASLWLAYASGNHDGTVFASPEEIDLQRDYSPPHLSFGFGEHFCLGAALARAEARIGLTVLLERFSHLSLDPANRFDFEPSYALHGLRELWLDYRAGPQSG